MEIKITLNNEANTKQKLSVDNPFVTDELLQQSIFLTSGVLKILDSNGDGTLTDEEINELYSIDKNGDKNISEDELQLSKLNGQNAGSLKIIESIFQNIGYSFGDQVNPTQESQSFGENALVEGFANFFSSNGQNVDVTVTAKDLVGTNLEEFKKIINLSPELKELFKSDKEIEDLFNLLKQEGSDKLTESDIKALVGLDGNSKELSAKDIKTFLKNKEKEAETETVPEQSPEASSTGGAGGSGGASGASSNGGANSGGTSNVGNTNTGNSSTQSTAGDRTPEEIQKEITQKEGEKDKVNTDTDAKIATEEETYDAAVATAMEEANVDEAIQKEYETRKDALDTEIDTQNEKIQTAETAIEDYTAVIEAKTSAIDAIDGQIASLESALNSIQDTGDPEKDKDNPAQRADINAKIANLRQEQARLKAEKETAEANKAKAIEDKNAATTARDTAEQQRSDLLTEMAKDPAYAVLAKVAEKVAEAKATRDENVQTLRQDQDSSLTTLNGDIQSLKTELAKAEEKEKTVALLKENRVPGSANGAIDFADMYENMTEAQMKDVFREKGYRFDSGFWCADFVKMALYEGVGEGNLPDWYVNSANPAHCQTLYDEARRNNAIINLDNAQPGDMVLFDWDGDGHSDHVGILVDDGDGVTIKTIEGNTYPNGYSQVAYNDRNMNTVMAIVSMRK